jgi:hypothetical protein
MSVPMTIESKAIKILEEYQGANNYILNLKSKLEKNPKFFPTTFLIIKMLYLKLPENGFFWILTLHKNWQMKNS